MSVKEENDFQTVSRVTAVDWAWRGFPGVCFREVRPRLSPAEPLILGAEAGNPESPGEWSSQGRAGERFLDWQRLLRVLS